jgi:DNA-binding NarL/FixJ family response regulator
MNEKIPGDTSFSVRVMLIDENKTFLRGLSSFLCQHAWIEIVGAILLDRRAKVVLQQVRPNVVLLGSGNSYSFVSEMIGWSRCNIPGMHVLVLADEIEPQYSRAWLVAGADGIIPKNELSTLLENTMRNVLTDLGKEHQDLGQVWMV